MSDLKIGQFSQRWRLAYIAQKSQIDDVRKALREGRADGISFCHPTEFDMAAIRTLPNLRAVSTPFAYEHDVSILSEVPTLEYLSLRDNRQPLDLNAFANLTVCHVTWQKGMKLPTRNRNTLFELRLWKLKTQTNDLREFDYPYLQRLDITQGTVDSLEGIQQLKSLRRADFAYLPKLRDVCAIAQTPVEFIHFENCKNVADFTCLKEAAQLWALDIMKSGDFESLNFLREFKHLKQFVFDANVVDGDLTPLLDLEFVGFSRGKKHFSHTVWQLRGHIEKQKGKLATAAYTMDWPLKY